MQSLPSYTDGAPPRTPTNRGHGITSRPLKRNPYLVIQMGHHHGHPLTGAMELRPDHWSATRRSHLEAPRNYTLTWTNIH